MHNLFKHRTVLHDNWGIFIQIYTKSCHFKHRIFFFFTNKFQRLPQCKCPHRRSAVQSKSRVLTTSFLPVTWPLDFSSEGNPLIARNACLALISQGSNTMEWLFKGATVSYRDLTGLYRCVVKRPGPEWFLQPTWNPRFMSSDLLCRLAASPALVKAMTGREP